MSRVDLPAWAQWRGGSPSDQFTIGIEEEFMLLDPRDWSLAFCSDPLIAGLPLDLRDRVTPETHAAVVEVATGVHRRVADAAAEVEELRRRMSRALARHGLRAAVAGMHPSAVWSDTVVSSHPRYREVGDSMRVLASREPTLATHVHVGIATPEAAVALLNRLRVHLPLLLALSANSPFWQGRDTGFASARTIVFGAFPRTGVPRSFRSYTDWVRTVDSLLRSGAVADPSHLWWDVRLQPRLGTVEVRIMDGQTRVEDVAALAALIQSLARFELQRPNRPGQGLPATEVIAENRFLAARDGMQALLIDGNAGERVPASAELARILALCRGHAKRLGCERELAAGRLLAAAGGASRQLAHAREGDLRSVTARLAHGYTADLPLEAGHELEPVRRVA
jgi:carboxylate-amine ligase